MQPVCQKWTSELSGVNVLSLNSLSPVMLSGARSPADSIAAHTNYAFTWSWVEGRRVAHVDLSGFICEECWIGFVGVEAC